MRRVVDKTNGFKTIMETFKDFRELSETLDSRDTVWTLEGYPQREDDDPYFKRCNSYDEAREYLAHGFDEDVNRMVQSVNALQRTGTMMKTKRYRDVAGFQPIVPRAIMGLPDSMMNQKKVRVKSKVITVVYDPGANGFVSHESIMEFGCKFINWCLNVERKGYRVKIEYMKAFCPTDGENRQYILRVPLKSEHQPLNIKRMSFALAHAAMQRYIAWDWVERLPGSKYMRGFGSSLGGNSYREKYLNNIKRFINEEDVVVYYGMDLDEELKRF